MKASLFCIIALAVLAAVDAAAMKCNCGTCPMVYSPLCGSDNVTYGNRCHFNCAACQNALLSINYSGPCITCDSSVACPSLWDPVCGSDGRTYGNACEFGNAARCDNTLSITHAGEC